MTILQGVVAVLVAAAGLATVTTRDPRSQAIVFSLFGSTLAVLFVVLQAPDVALSVIVVGAAYPLMILLTLGRVRARKERSSSGQGAERDDPQDREGPRRSGRR